MTRLQSNQTSLQLDKVQYIPKLVATKLILISYLNDYSIKVIFKPRQTIKVYKDYRLVFSSSIRSGLVILDLKPLSQYPPEASTYTAMPTTAALELVSASANNSVNYIAKETKFDLWYQRLVHTNIKTIQELTKVVDGLDIGKKPE